MTIATNDELLVTRIERFDPESESASITLQSDVGRIVVFSHPCEHEVGARVPNRLRVLDTTLLQTPCCDDWPEDERDAATRERLEHVHDYAYRGCGRVVDPHEGLVRVHGFILDFGEVPAGARFVEFEVVRLDLW